MTWKSLVLERPGPADTQTHDRLPPFVLTSALAVLACGCDATSQAPPGEHGLATSLTCPQAEPVWSDIDLASFEPIPHLRNLDLTGRVMPGEPSTYWELRSAMPSGHSVLARAGQACADSSNPQECHMMMGDLRSNAGFSHGCLPLRCIFYLVVNRGDQLEMITDRPGVLKFLGIIDMPMEAVLLAFAHGFTWHPDEIDLGGLRAVQGGFELLVSRLVSDCDPVTIDRFLLTVTADGAIIKQRQQHASVACGACI